LIFIFIDRCHYADATLPATPFTLITLILPQPLRLADAATPFTPLPLAAFQPFR
jgi:hypothetical protein